VVQQKSGVVSAGAVAMSEFPVKRQGELMVAAVKERGEGGHD
tara:strand:+ start:70 stop:195 length:126 start_codon:yes stop_codon:yes gene_type:complete